MAEKIFPAIDIKSVPVDFLDGGHLPVLSKRTWVIRFADHMEKIKYSELDN